MPNSQGKYETPYVSGITDVGDNTGEMGRFIARTLKLPTNVQNVFRDFSTAEFIEEKLGQTFGLSGDQKAELTRILRDILLADLFWGDFPKEISARLQVDPDTANQIVKTITDQLLAPALEDIKAMQKEKFKDRIEQGVSSQGQQSPVSSSEEQGNVINLRNRNNQ